MAKLSLAQLPWKAQLAVLLLLSVAAAGGFFYFFELPVQARISEKEGELASVRARIDKGLATARQLPEFRKEVAALEARLESLKSILPEEKDAADLLRRVNLLALESNLTIRGFRPQAVNTRDLHVEWPITLELEGTYHNLGRFLDRVSRFPRIINVGALDIRERDGEQQPNASIAVTCTATTFVLLEDSAAKEEGETGESGTAKKPGKAAKNSKAAKNAKKA